jgi:hypothetical protein
MNKAEGVNQKKEVKSNFTLSKDQKAQRRKTMSKKKQTTSSPLVRKASN